MEHSQFCEHAVKEKVGGTRLAQRILLCLLYAVVLFVAALLGLVWKAFLPAVVVALLIDLSLHLLLWRRTVLEFEYSMTGGTLTFSRIYGGSTRKVVFEVDMKKLLAAFPYGQGSNETLSRYEPEVQYFALASENAADNADTEIWCAIFENEDGKTAAFYFELTDTAYRFLKIHASGVTAPRTRRSDAVKTSKTNN